MSSWFGGYTWKSLQPALTVLHILSLVEFVKTIYGINFIILRYIIYWDKMAPIINSYRDIGFFHYCTALTHDHAKCLCAWLLKVTSVPSLTVWNLEGQYLLPKGTRYPFMLPVDTGPPFSTWVNWINIQHTKVLANHNYCHPIPQPCTMHSRQGPEWHIT